MHTSTKKGFAPIVAIIIALLAIGGGVYGVKKIANNKKAKMAQLGEEKMAEEAAKGNVSVPGTIESAGVSQKQSKKTLQIKLNEQNGSGQAGQAVIVQIGTSTLRVILSITGKPSDVLQPAHIHVGACPNPGSVKFPLTDVGKGASQTDIPNMTLAQLLSGLPLAINVHKSAADAKMYIACGDIKAGAIVEMPAVPAAQPKVETVGYSASGFSPNTLGIKRGDTVLWKSNGTAMWVGANEHPTHTQYDGTTLKEHCAQKSATTFDQCARGDVFSFTFTKVGTFKYHNHAKASDGGTITVTDY